MSVIIATHNRAGTLVEAVESVLAQSFGDFEVIVADDGSSDDTAARIGEIDGPIRYFRLPRSGVIARVRNHGLRHARGELIAFLDDDDAWEPQKLAGQVAVLDADPAVGLVYTGFSVLGDDGSVHIPKLAPWQSAPGPLLGRLLHGCFIHPSTVLVRRTLAERVGGFDERRSPCEDYDFLLRLAPLTRGVCIAEPLMRLRRRAVANSLHERPERAAAVYEVSISILEDWLAGGALDLRQRVLCRASLANLHVKAARIAQDAGKRGSARRHALAAVGRNPLRRPAWATLGRCLLARP